MNVIKFETIDSTNTWALEHFEELEDKSVVISDAQTNGKGRFERKWVSGNFGNIYLSLVLKPENKDYVVNLTQYLSVVTAKLLERYGVTPEIKWPNDVLVNGLKICGILCEAYRKKNVLYGVVLGVGINLNMPEEIIKNIDRPATSLNLLLDKQIQRDEFLKMLLEEFFLNYEKAVTQGFSFIKKDYLKYVGFLSKKVKLQQRDGAPIEEYVAKTLNDEGNLVVQTLDNQEKTVYSGDLIL